ncbi:MAG: DUF4328 domain-containing protein [Saprospiraceae bacterium]
MDIRDNTERAKMATNIFYVMGVVILGMIISDIMQYNLLIQEFYTAEEANSNDSRQMLIGGIYLIFLVACAYVFINWMRRAYYNLHQLKGDLKHQESYAAWSWFIPFINLWYPYQIMKEIWIYTQTKSDIENIVSHSLVRLWWIAWIINNVASNISARFPMDTIDDLLIGTQLSIFSDITSFLALVLAIQMIKKVSTFEQVLYHSNYEMSIEDHLIE